MSPHVEIPGLTLGRDDFERARANVAPHVYHTPLLTSRSLSEATGFDVRLKAELFQRGGSYKVRGPLNVIANLTEEERARGIICSSAGNHSQGVAIAAAQYGIPAVVLMAENATKSKIAATEGYGAEVVLHGTIWDEANERALELVEERGLTYVHPFDDPRLIAGQGTLGLEILEDWPEVELAVIPIGGGGLISGNAMSLRSINPDIRVIGVESSGAPAMKRSVESGELVTLEEVSCIIDGLRVKRVGDNTASIVSRFVENVVTLPDEEIFDAVLWLMTRAKLVAEGAAASGVAALLAGLIDAPPGTKVVCVLSGGNLDVEQLRGLRWN
ncbi:MAG: pyridoxal-phosphate dependent enzyme [Gemmatimonadetes bacterium]|nr:pyridoxal-phosphate dependent enzyme [Gemmatimonadota bacterium]